MRVGNGWTAANAAEAGERTRGWFMGPFTDYAPALSSQGMQVKWGEHKSGELRDGWADADETTTVCVLVSGSILFRFRAPGSEFETVVLREPGDFVTWSRVAHRWTSLTDGTRTLTIRWVEAPAEPR